MRPNPSISSLRKDRRTLTRASLLILTAGLAVFLLALRVNPAIVLGWTILALALTQYFYPSLAAEVVALLLRYLNRLTNQEPEAETKAPIEPSTAPVTDDTPPTVPPLRTFSLSDPTPAPVDPPATPPPPGASLFGDVKAAAHPLPRRRNFTLLSLGLILCLAAALTAWLSRYQETLFPQNQAELKLLDELNHKADQSLSNQQKLADKLSSQLQGNGTTTGGSDFSGPGTTTDTPARNLNCDDLRKCLGLKVNADGTLNLDGKSITIDPGQLDTLRKSLETQIGKIGTSSPSTWSILKDIAFFVLLVGIALAVARPLLKKHPSATAPLGAVTLAAAAIKEAEHLVSFTSSQLTTLIFILAGFATLVFVLCLLQLFKRGGGEKDGEIKEALPEEDRGVDQATRTEEKKEVAVPSSPLSVAFSITVLLWALVIVSHQHKIEDKDPVHPATTADTNKPAQAITHDFRNLSIYGFDNGSAAITPSRNKELPNEVARLRDALQTYKHDANDLLLLFGSTDCSERQSGSNENLAFDRAAVIRKALQESALNPAFNIEIEALDQQANCKQSPSLRSVYPVLIHHKDAGATTAVK